MVISLTTALIIFLFTGISLLRLIQTKDYFFPSLWAHFDYPSSYKIFFRKREFFLIIIWLYLIILSFNNGKIYLNYNTLIILLIIFGFLLYLRRGQVKKIKWSLKGIFIFILMVIINDQILNVTNNDLAVIVILSTTAIQFSIAIFSTFIANIITIIYSKFLFRKTKRKIRLWLKENPNKLIIGISGSYGKTSTKEIVAHLLEIKFKVLKSPLRLNAEIGLAKFILSQKNLESYDIIVLELGSRQKGEIAKMVDIFQPKYVFLTGLGPQHIATFGSFQDMIQGEMEILNAVKNEEGIAFLNANDKWIKEYTKEINIKNKYFYGAYNSDFYFKDEILSLDGSEFTFIYPEGEERLFTNIVGNQFLENISGALGLCYVLGIKPYQLKERLKTFNLLPNQFEVVRKENPLIINDSYNANLVGVKKGIEFFNKIFNGNKILIFGGLIELGEEKTYEFYKELVDYFKNFDLIILTFFDFTNIFTSNLDNSKVIIYKNQNFNDLIKNFDLNNLGIIILGRIPEKLLIEIKKYNE
ncbi:MAG: hypothetical protein KatS3mg095_0840 [Candidatus Parcubacteria bacterium]|nr:MAG: hypothetical protein KatS3mg095_0840 [Candidatus Parcubacteria bacterium]